jgi:hypothetical protein
MTVPSTDIMRPSPLEDWEHDVMLFARNNDMQGGGGITYGFRDDLERVWYIDCSDTFWWGTSDVHLIGGKEDFDLLVTCFNDIVALEKDKPFAERSSTNAENHLAALYAGRKREMRPMHLYLEGFASRDGGPLLVDLLETCGPERSRAEEG